MSFLSKNIGPLDRTLRVSGGVVPLLTGVIGTCPLYSLFGFSTCARARR